MTSRLRFDAVSFAYGANPVVEKIDLALPLGSFVALIGPNGAGKTTLLNLASGTVQPTAGRVWLDGTDLRQFAPKQRAQRIAVVPQSIALSVDFTARELVGLGRIPHLQPLRGERAADRAAIERALAVTQTTHLAGRSVLELSGGERQRVILAMALAQEPDLLLLDEPTANLDVSHQIDLLELARELNRTTGLTVLATIHDLNLAALFFPRLVVLGERRILADGPPDQVLTAELVERVFGAAVRVVDHPTEAVPLLALLRHPVGEGRVTAPG